MADTGDDLLGHSWIDEDDVTWTVTGPWIVGPAGYVLCSGGPGDTIIRPIHAVRQHKLAVAKDADSSTVLHSEDIPPVSPAPSPYCCDPDDYRDCDCDC